ncbi:hypothetical protein [Dermatobacter hominis]|uniref:hypothetical protein n=1 Tax=Dermatobacter hominis TaxID=2884263 RepID=UPI001D115648|nr:hypothetical protein [Dermatobacter hominis]UDY34901.1 hypothetical protein LH044_16380 [Dermatobacter hominis]
MTGLAERLLDEGCIRIPAALDAAFCEDVTLRAIGRLGVREDDPTTWPTGTEHLPVEENWSVADVAPAAAAVIDELCGGGRRIAFAGIQDNLIVNFPADPGAWWPPDRWDAPSAGWHKDGDWFRHFLDSPEQALLVIVFWRDVVERQGPTYLAVDSIRAVADLLVAHPEGLEPAEVLASVPDILRRCDRFEALTGAQGDIVLCHPFVLHTASVNAAARVPGSLRCISNTSVMLRRPMDVAADEPTPLERSVQLALGGGPVHFHATGERGKVVSARELRWKAERDQSARSDG